MRRIALLALLLATSLCGADISGRSKGTAEGPNGAIERTFTFKVDGSKLTGEAESEMLGKATINDGRSKALTSHSALTRTYRAMR
jgi:hypothetical protein